MRRERDSNCEILHGASNRNGPHRFSHFEHLPLSEDAVDALNERLLESINQTGEIFISHTKLMGRFTLRLAIGNLRTTERHVARAWELLQLHAAQLAKS